MGSPRTSETQKANDVLRDRLFATFGNDLDSVTNSKMRRELVEEIANYLDDNNLNLWNTGAKIKSTDKNVRNSRIMKGLRKFMQGGGANRSTREAITIGLERMISKGKTKHNAEYMKSINGGNNVHSAITKTVTKSVTPTPAPVPNPIKKTCTDDDIYDILDDALTERGYSGSKKFDILRRVAEGLEQKA